MMLKSVQHQSQASFAAIVVRLLEETEINTFKYFDILSEKFLALVINFYAIDPSTI